MLTACGIETNPCWRRSSRAFKLQQCLPLAVLKQSHTWNLMTMSTTVATVLTACGIETIYQHIINVVLVVRVATVLTACGIETIMESLTIFLSPRCNSAYRLRY